MSSDYLASLPPPGDLSFLPALHDLIRHTAPDVPLDSVVFQSLLLALITGGKHVILRVPEDDIGVVLKLVVLILTRVFDIRTHKYKHKLQTRPSSYSHPTSALSSTLSSPTTRPNALPLPSHTSPSTSPHRDKRREPRTGTPRKDADDPGDFFSALFPVAASSSSLGSEGERNDVKVHGALAVSGLENAPLPLQRALIGVLDKIPENVDFDDSGLPNGNRPIRRPFQRSASSYSYACNSGRDESNDSEEPEGPSLPPGFIVVYVCAADARSPPAIHKSLLDRFAISASPVLSTQVRTVLLSMHSVTAKPILPLLPIPPIPPSRPPALPPSFLPTLRRLCTQVVIPPAQEIYLLNLISAALHNSFLVAPFSARTTRDLRVVAQAGRICGSEWVAGELLQSVVQEKELEKQVAVERVYTPHNGDIPADAREEKAQESTDTEGEQQEAAMGGMAAAAGGGEKVDLGPLSDFVPSPSPPPSLRSHKQKSPSVRSASSAESVERAWLSTSLAVSAADIARVFPRVVSHRVRVRPRSEGVLSGAVWGACARPDAGWVERREGKEGKGEGRERDSGDITVRVMMVAILSEV